MNMKTLFKKGKKGPKCNVTLAAALTFVAVSAFAATSGTTVTGAVNPYIGSAPVIGEVSATVTTVGAPVLAALPTSSKTIKAVVCSVRDTNNNAKTTSTFISGTDIAVIASGMTSGTVAVGDRVNCIITYER